MIPELHLGIQVGSIPASGTNNLTLKIYEKVQTKASKTHECHGNNGGSRPDYVDSFSDS